jgi:glycine cleavage system H protein
MSIPKECRYTKDHEWAKAESTGKYLVGITDYAQTELGDVVFIELPEVGRSVKKGEAFGTVESVKAVSEIYAPVSGKIVEVNSALASAPEKINSSPYGEAWMIRLQAANESEASELMDAAKYEAYLAEISK